MFCPENICSEDQVDVSARRNEIMPIDFLRFTLNPTDVRTDRQHDASAPAAGKKGDEVFKNCILLHLIFFSAEDSMSLQSL